jgi:hypothetical protein
MATIADGVALRAALGYIGFNNVTHTGIVESGFVMIMYLMTSNEKSLN